MGAFYGVTPVTIELFIEDQAFLWPYHQCCGTWTRTVGAVNFWQVELEPEPEP